jgi:hypothetical protein
MVKPFRNQFLARAAFPDHKDGAVQRRGPACPLDCIEKGKALPDELSAPLHAPTVGAESYALASRFGPPVACFQRFSLEFPTVWKIGTTLE